MGCIIVANLEDDDVMFDNFIKILLQFWYLYCMFHMIHELKFFLLFCIQVGTVSTTVNGKIECSS